MKLSETMQNTRKFTLFSTALMTIQNANTVLLRLGADVEAGKYIQKGLEVIYFQLKQVQGELAKELEAVQYVENFLDIEGKDLGVKKSDSPS
jgi:hypothetical protein